MSFHAGNTPKIPLVHLHFLHMHTQCARVAVAFLSTHVSLTRRDATWIHVKDNRQVDSTSLLQEVSEMFFFAGNRNI